MQVQTRHFVIFKINMEYFLSDFMADDCSLVIQMFNAKIHQNSSHTKNGPRLSFSYNIKVGFDRTSQIINTFLNVNGLSMVPFKTFRCKWNKNTQRRLNNSTKTWPVKKPQSIVLYFKRIILKYNTVRRGGTYKIPFQFKTQISKNSIQVYHIQRIVRMCIQI